MKDVGFFVSPGYAVLDLAGPFNAFQSAMRPDGSPAYKLHVVSTVGGMIFNSVGLGVTTTPVDRIAMDTLIMIGGDVSSMLEESEGRFFATAAARARRVASVCTGAFMLAHLGLLDGRRATTHWRFVPRLQRDYPAIDVVGDCIFVSDGRVSTSGGMTAGIDLSLALIEQDLGLSVARDVAKFLVVYYRRPGGQSQFSELSQLDGESDRIRKALSFVRDHLADDIRTQDLADAAGLSLRQFGRAFRRETAETPAKAIERLRVEAAKTRIEQGAEPIEVIARSVGFNDPERMRRAFVRIYGRSPLAVRKSRFD